MYYVFSFVQLLTYSVGWRGEPGENAVTWIVTWTHTLGKPEYAVLVV